ncbi:MAG: hypothetical protein DMF64_11065 [Acidobacteria bacterium]|nr:MAG: hypothetical protein DMF64_11065 [Acidobacteriota bacterium]
MLVIEPSALRFEEEALGVGQQEELIVERLSAMEHNLTRMLGHLERSTDLLQQQAQIVTREHMLLQALLSLLSETGLIDLDKLAKLWESNCAQESEAERRAKRRESLCAEIVENYQGRAAQQFARLVNEGFAAFARQEDHAIEAGWRLLERAAVLAPEHGLLVSLLARNFFNEGKTALARSYLERAVKLFPQDVSLHLLLALTRGDEGDPAGAHELLQTVEQLEHVPRFALHYARGRLFAHDGRWREALAEFKRALAARAAPEAHYVVALAAYQLGYLKLAAQHIAKTLAVDDKYVEAHRLSGLILRKSGAAARARAAFALAGALAADGKRKNARARAARFTDELLLRSFFGAQSQRLLTGGDERLAALLRTAAQGG